MMPAQGAEQVTEHCGGLRAVLHSIGVNLSLASDRYYTCQASFILKGSLHAMPQEEYHRLPVTMPSLLPFYVPI